MKILLIAPQPFFTVRGTPINISNICRALSLLGHKIDILTYPLGQDITIKNTRIYRIPKLPGLKNIPIGPSLIKIPLDILLFFKAFQLCLKNRYCVIHAVEESIFFAVLLKKFFRTPLIYDMDSSIPQQLAYSNFFQNKALLKLASAIENWAINNTNTIISVCTELTLLVSVKHPNKKIFQIEDIPIIDYPHHSPRENIAAWKREFGLEANKIVLYTGNLENYQGIELLLKSFVYVIQQEPTAKLLLVGGKTKNIEIMKRLATNLKIINNVLFTGPRPLAEMPQFMALCDILVSPRIAGTNTPLKIFTYLQSGKPIVATALRTHTQILNPNIAILSKPDEQSFSNGIIKILSNPSLGKDLGERGKNFVIKNYNFNTFSDKVNNVYNFIKTLQ